MKWKALVVLLGVFLLGIGGGVVLDRIALHRDGFWGRHRPPMDRMLHHLTRQLDLSERQQEDVRAILMTTRTELERARQQTWHRVDGILQTSETRIQQVLEPEQREAFEQLMVEHRQPRKDRREHFRQ